MARARPLRWTVRDRRGCSMDTESGGGGEKEGTVTVLWSHGLPGCHHDGVHQQIDPDRPTLPPSPSVQEDRSHRHRCIRGDIITAQHRWPFYIARCLPTHLLPSPTLQSSPSFPQQTTVRRILPYHLTLHPPTAPFHHFFFVPLTSPHPRPLISLRALIHWHYRAVDGVAPLEDDEGSTHTLPTAHCIPL